MAPRVDPVLTTSELPAETEIVVIGGGIVGASTALFLAERGVPVALCEKGTVACEQSSRNWGWCRKMGRDLAEVPLAGFGHGRDADRRPRALSLPALGSGISAGDGRDTNSIIGLIADNSPRIGHAS